MGGTGVHPTYENYTYNNNFSETVRVEYDGAKTNFTSLLSRYWASCGDPTFQPFSVAYSLRIFAIPGTDQFEQATASVAAVQKKYKQPVLVSVLDASQYTFWKAEEYHQQYFQKQHLPCPPQLEAISACSKARAWVLQRR